MGILRYCLSISLSHSQDLCSLDCILGKIFSQSGGVTRRLPREVVEPAPLEVFKSHGYVAMRDMGSGHGGSGLRIGLWMILVVFSSLNDSMIQY